MRVFSAAVANWFGAGWVGEAKPVGEEDGKLIRAFLPGSGGLEYVWPSESLRNYAAGLTCSVLPSTATTSTVLPAGRSGPLTSHRPSPTRALPRPLTIGSTSS